MIYLLTGRHGAATRPRNAGGREIDVGSFFTNVQVHAGERSPDEVREAMIAAVRTYVRAAGFEEISESSDEEPDRVILVAPPGPGPWIAVYDEATDDQDTELLRALAEALSPAGNAAVGILVHDSSFLLLQLCRAGAQVDVFHSRPEHYDDPGRPDYAGRPSTPEERQAVAGRPDLWFDLLVPGATPAQLRAALDTRPTFADDMLWSVARLVGWDAQRCGIGYTYLSRGEQDLTGFARLAFRATRVSRAAMLGEGPPALIPFGGEGSLVVAPGGSFTISAMFQSTGDAGRGLRLVVWGPALEQPLVEPRSMILLPPLGHRPAVRGVGGAVFGPTGERRELPLARGRAADGMPLWHAQVDDFEIPRGLKAAPTPWLEASGGPSARRMLEAQVRATLGIAVAGTALVPGEGELYVGATPLEYENGQAAWGFRVVVTSA